MREVLRKVAFPDSEGDTYLKDVDRDVVPGRTPNLDKRRRAELDGRRAGLLPNISRK